MKSNNLNVILICHTELVEVLSKGLLFYDWLQQAQHDNSFRIKKLPNTSIIALLPQWL